MVVVLNVRQRLLERAACGGRKPANRAGKPLTSLGANPAYCRESNGADIDSPRNHFQLMNRHE